MGCLEGGRLERLALAWESKAESRRIGPHWRQLLLHGQLLCSVPGEGRAVGGTTLGFTPEAQRAHNPYLPKPYQLHTFPHSGSQPMARGRSGGGMYAAGSTTARGACSADCSGRCCAKWRVDSTTFLQGNEESTGGQAMRVGRAQWGVPGPKLLEFWWQQPQGRPDADGAQLRCTPSAAVTPGPPLLAHLVQCSGHTWPGSAAAHLWHTSSTRQAGLMPLKHSH